MLKIVSGGQTGVDQGALAAALAEFVTGNGVRVLNVAGPRASKWAGAFGYAKGLLIGVLGP